MEQLARETAAQFAGAAVEAIDTRAVMARPRTSTERRS
jgi:hypothetical protein